MCVCVCVCVRGRGATGGGGLWKGGRGGKPSKHNNALCFSKIAGNLPLSTKKNYTTNKTIINFLDDFWWCSDLLDLVDNSPSNKRSCRYFLVVIDNFCRNGRTIPVKNKHAQTITKSFSQIITISNRKPSLLETDDEKGYVNKIFNDFLEQNNVERYYRHSNRGAKFAERFNRTIRNLL